MTRSPELPSAPAAVALRSLVLGLGLVTLAACGPDDGPGATDAAGQEAFETHCITCHGPGGQGTEQGPPLVHIVYEPSHHSDDAFRAAVREGVPPHHWEFGPMPPVPDISDAEVEAVITYVRQLQREAGIE